MKGIPPDAKRRSGERMTGENNRYARPALASVSGWTLSSNLASLVVNKVEPRAGNFLNGLQLPRQVWG